MAPVPKNHAHQNKQHQKFTSHAHQNHPLTHHSDEQPYVCHACNTPGFGPRFRCHACHVDIHVYCADCPQELSSFLHRHPLALVLTQPRLAGSSHNRPMRICNVCREATEGQVYRCKDCHFHVHPLCTRLPKKLRHVIDPSHELTLRKPPSPPARCAVCKTDCSSLWVYGCDACKLNIHIKCLRKPCGSRGMQRAAAGPNFPHGYYAWGYPGPVQFNPSPSHPPNHAAASSSSLGSLFGNTMFSLVGNVAAGALADFIFGSIGF